MCRQCGNVAAGEINIAFTGARIAEHRHHQGRLAGAVGADQRDDLAFVDINVDTFEGDDAAVLSLYPRSERSGSFAALTVRPPLRPARLPRQGRRDRRRSLWNRCDIMRRAVGDFHAVIEHDNVVGISITTPMSCSISRIEMPCSSRSVSRNALSSALSRLLRPAAGSSRHSSTGSDTWRGRFRAAAGAVGQRARGIVGAVGKAHRLSQ